MLDTLNKETIMQKRIKVYDKYRNKEVGRLNIYYPYRIFARSRYNGVYLKPTEINIICRFMAYYLTEPKISIDEILFRLGPDVVEHKQRLYDVINKQNINTEYITEIDRIIMYVFCNRDYNIEKTKEWFEEYFLSDTGIERIIEQTLNLFGVDKIVWHDDYKKFMYDNFIRYYDTYDEEKNNNAKLLYDDARNTLYTLGDPKRFKYKHHMFKFIEKDYGTDFIIENYYDAFKQVAELGSYGKMLDSLQRSDKEIKVKDVRWLVDHEWALDLIQREMGFSSRYALKRYLDKYNIDYSKCKKRPGRPRGTFKNSSARNQMYEDFSKGLVPDTIYDKYKGKYSKRSIDRIYVEWKHEQK